MPKTSILHADLPRLDLRDRPPHVTVVDDAEANGAHLVLLPGVDLADGRLRPDAHSSSAVSYSERRLGCVPAPRRARPLPVVKLVTWWGMVESTPSKK